MVEPGRIKVMVDISDDYPGYAFDKYNQMASERKGRATALVLAFVDDNTIAVFGQEVTVDDMLQLLLYGMEAVGPVQKDQEVRWGVRPGASEPPSPSPTEAVGTKRTGGSVLDSVAAEWATVEVDLYSDPRVSASLRRELRRAFYIGQTMMFNRFLSSPSPTQADVDRTWGELQTFQDELSEERSHDDRPDPR